MLNKNLLVTEHTTIVCTSPRVISLYLCNLMMNRYPIGKAPCLERQLGLKLPMTVSGTFISIHRRRCRKVVYYGSKYLNHVISSNFTRTRSARKLNSYIWARADNSTLSSFDWVQKSHWALLGDELFSTFQTVSHRGEVARLSLLYH